MRPHESATSRGETLDKLRERDLIRYYGIALGPAIGWQYEGINCVRQRTVTSLQHIYNVLEQHPGAVIQNAATAPGRDTMFLIRVPHSSGMLEGHYTAETKFPPNDHRSHRPRAWLLNGAAGPLCAFATFHYAPQVCSKSESSAKESDRPLVPRINLYHAFGNSATIEGKFDEWVRSIHS
jgi:hypothetical protein